MSERAAVQAVPWVMPEVSGPIANRRTRHDKTELDEIGREAWEEGFTKGLEAGNAAALGEMRTRTAALEEKIARFEGVLAALSQPLAELDEHVERELAGLACTIARHVVRRELRIDPTQVIAAVREAVGLLPIAARDVRVYLHPEDAAVLRERLAEPRQERAWTVVEDPVLLRGGCRVVSENSQVDARLDSRLGAVIATVLGDERGGTHEPETVA